MNNRRICKFCEKSYSSSANLKQHIRNTHEGNSNNSTGRFSCESCGKIFYHLNSLRFHMKIHGNNIDLTNQSSTVVDMIIRNSRKCPICEYSNPPRGNLLHHLVLQHQVALISEEIKFTSESCFYEWKHEIEEADHCKFVQRNSAKKSKLLETTNFICHRSGFYVVTEKNEMDENKAINPYCPASIRLEKKNDGTCDVSYLKTHLGHDNDLDPVQLPSSDDSPNEILDLKSERIDPESSTNDNECVEPRRIVSEQQFGLEMASDLVVKPEPEVILPQPSDNTSTSNSESLEDEKQELIDRITKHIRNIKSRSKLDILGKMTDKLIEVLNETNNP